MEKRKEQRKQRRSIFKERLQKTLAVLLCFVLLVFLINITDMSTRRMMMCNDDRYAMAVSMQEGDMLRLDVAGEKYIINVEPAARVAEYIITGSRKCCEGIVKLVRDKL